MFSCTKMAVAFLVLSTSGAAAVPQADGGQRGDGFRSAEVSVPPAGRTGFFRMSPATTGITFTNRLSSDRYVTNQIHLNGSGVAAGDVDGDGRCDLYFCSLGGGNILYRNLGEWKFSDVTDSAGVRCAGLDCTGAVLADLDGDEDLDLLVNAIAQGTRCFLNDGKGKFTEITRSAPWNPGRGGMSMALADIDGDGDLDLYVTNYRADTIRDHPQTRLQGDRDKRTGQLVVQRVNGRPATEPDLVGRFTLTDSGRIIEHGELDLLLRNDGGGKFTPLPFTDGRFLDEDGRPLTEPPYDWGLAVMFRDINDDRYPDIYVCNDFASADRIWMNDGKGNFRALPRLSLRHTSMFSMGIDFSDVNRDGFDDFFVADMLSRFHAKRHLQVGEITPIFPVIGRIDDRPQYSENTLHLNRGDGTYADVARHAGLSASEWSWTPIFLDVDLDGYEDLLVTTGHELEMMNADVSNEAEAIKARKQLSIPEQLALRKMFPRLDSGNVAFRNRGNLTFEDVSVAWGFDARGVSHGMALGDLDGDGDQDVAVNNLNGAAGIYRNESGAPRVAVRLKGLAPNTRGIGAKVWVYGGAVPVQSQEIICGGRYLSSDDPMRVFAAGNMTNELRIEVNWRSGRRSVVAGVKANRIYEIDEAGAEAEPSSKLKAQSSKELPRSNHQLSTINHQPVFEDVSALLQHVHHEEEFNDYGRQPLLPRKLSQGGPGVSWHDVDGDGWEDLIIGSGKGGTLAVYRNDRKGGFERVGGSPLNLTVARDQTGVLAMEGRVMAGSANYEDGLTNGGCLKIYDLNRKASGESILGQSFSAGPLALGDVDRDGDLDLFVGGQVLPGRYPEPADSLVMNNDGGRLVVRQRLTGVGLVNGAVFSDLDSDGQPDLILACEWGPVRIYRNEQGKLVPWDAPVTLNSQLSTLNQLTGWWNGVTAGDFDGDGKLDLIASNYGLNGRYQASWKSPGKVYYGDFGSGGVDIVEAYYDEGMKGEVPERGLKAVGSALPWVREKVGTFEAYGKARLAEIYGERLKRAGVTEVNTLETMMFLNRGDRFEARALPREAQLSPAFAVCVGDYDGDGNEDVFLSQNFFAVNPDTARNDAGRGLWLQGDGKGGFRSVPGQQSGVKVYGEQRGAALCDYDRDGRVDLVVTQNGAETRLFRNQTGRPGLRVRMRGAAENPTAVGAQVRLKFGERWGALREIHAGSGYWSQDSAICVMGIPEPSTRIQVRWPGGKEIAYEVPLDSAEVELGLSGEIKRIK